MIFEKILQEIEIKVGELGQEVEIPALKRKLFNGAGGQVDADRRSIQMAVFGFTGEVKSESGTKLEINRDDATLLLYDKDGKLINSYSVDSGETKQAIEDFILNSMIY